MTLKTEFNRGGYVTTLRIMVAPSSGIMLHKFGDGECQFTIFDPSRELLEALRATVEKALE